MSREYPSLCNFKNELIFAIGGQPLDNLTSNSIQRETATVEYYSIALGIWVWGPNLNYARKNHSSAVLSDCIYVFCGQDLNQTMINNIEKL